MEQHEYQQYDAVGLAELVAKGDVTPAELLATAQRRADEVNPTLNAIVRRTDDRAEARVNEHTAGELKGPFAGVPFLVKDLAQEQAGIPCSWGSRSLMDVPARENATVVDRWLDAGLMIFGRTNTPEFGAKGVTEPTAWGPARNPWATNHTPGGSSGGSAAAVAAGIVPCAGANDGGGSIRIPASCCGLVGLKPGRGVVPSGPSNAEMLLGSATHGVVSRTVRDSAAMLDVLAGSAPEAPYLAATEAGTYAARLGEGPGTLRIGVQLTTEVTPQPHPEARAAIEATVALLEELGHEVHHLPAPVCDDRALVDDFLITWFAGKAQLVDSVKAQTGCGDDAFEQDTLVSAAIGRGANTSAYLDAVDRRQLHVRRLADFHARYDLLLTPTTATPPPRIGEHDPHPIVRRAGDFALKAKLGRAIGHLGVVEKIVERNVGWVPYTQLANLTGRPAISVPLHWTADGLPIGSQFVGALGSEGLLLRLAAQLEEARPWAAKRPPLTATGTPV
ncbi:MAG: amidase [Solirubrobacteraceae bacterium]|nr:amidase [Solirubrobacteraceae bacterium]